jgi:ubiquinone/menaquinone biosynthesis C-methylase UbiE
MATKTTDRLTAFYAEMSSTAQEIIAAVVAAGVAPDHVQARDLYTRDLDCHNLGMHTMLEVLADVVTEYAAPGPHETVLDLGCGMGGPGRFIVDRFGCKVLGVDLLPLRVEIAEALTEKTGLSDRISYRVADATALELDAASFAQVWMLDVGMHIRDKRALFAEIARVLKPGGLFVMHDQTGPLPAAMRPVMRQAPYIAPTLHQLIRHVEDPGMRMLTWRDTTDRVLEHFLALRAMLGPPADASARAPEGRQLKRGRVLLDAYIETLAHQGGRTGMLVAKRVARE